jgi:hypothetical protein
VINNESFEYIFTVVGIYLRDMAKNSKNGKNSDGQGLGYIFLEYVQVFQNNINSFGF